MTRERQIVETFVELADTLVAEFDVIEFLHRVSERCVEILDCTEAGVLLADTAGSLRVMASSSERSDTLDLMQAQNDEGPCYECFKRGQTISSENLDSDRDRWPLFAEAAVDRGFASIQAIPMRAQGETVGALNLFRIHPGVLAEPDLPVAQGMADIAAIALMQERLLRESRGVAEQLQGALTSRVLIEQAKGVLAERGKISLDQAFARLRDHARRRGSKLSDIASQLIDGTLPADELFA